MMNIKKIYTVVLAGLMAGATLHAQNIFPSKGGKLSAKDTIRDNAIVIPEDMQRNYDQLLHDWRKYFVPSRDCDKSGDFNITYPDSVYINRLYAMPTVMEMAYNQITRSYINMYTERRRSQVEYMLGLGKYYFPIFEQALERHRVPLELKYLPVIESALNPKALSPAGASGLWQFMAHTGRLYGLEVNSLVDERRDPIKASDAAARYLAHMYNIYGDWNLVIAAYNCGPGNVNKAIRRSGGKRDYWAIYPYLPRETRGYVPAFIAANYAMTYYKKHNLCPMEYTGKEPTDTIHVNKTLHLQQIAEVINIPLDRLRDMNPQYKTDVVPGNYRTYSICLPVSKVGEFIHNQDSIFTHRSSDFLVHRKVVQFSTQTNDNASGGVKTLYHYVKRGETVTKVAQRYGVSASDLKRWNGLRSNTLKRGRRLVIRIYSKEKTVSQEVTTTNKQEAVTPATGSLATPVQKVSNAEIDWNSYFPPKSKNNAAVKQDTPAQPKTVEKAPQSSPKVTQSPVVAPPKAANVSNSLIHKVVAGETLYRIANKYNVAAEDVMKWNKLTGTQVKEGQELVIMKRVSSTLSDMPPKSSAQESVALQEYEVRRGDNLSKIAQKFQVSVADLENWNSLRSGAVQVGQKLIVGKSVVGATTKKTSAKEKTPVMTEYEVQRGDNLAKIAEKFQVTVDDLEKWNNLTSKAIRAGQKLVVYPPTVKDKTQKEVGATKKQRTQYHTVRKGETLDEIARKYPRTTVREIKTENGLKSDKLSVGQKLRIP